MWPSNKPAEQSLIKLSSTVVVDKCRNTLAHIKALRVSARQSTIDEYRSIMVNKWWHKFRKKPIPTDDEVVKYIENNPYNELGVISIRYSAQEEIAQNLLQVSSFADEVYVSVYDWHMVSR